MSIGSSRKGFALNGSISPKSPAHLPKNPVVEQMLAEVGPECLPLILVDGRCREPGSLSVARGVDGLHGNCGSAAGGPHPDIVLRPFDSPGPPFVRRKTAKEDVAEEADAVSDAH